MSLEWTPHNVEVRPVTDPPDVTTKIADNPTAGSETTIPCFVEAISPTQSQNDWGIVPVSPHRVMVDKEYASYFTLESRVLWVETGITLFVAAEPMQRIAGDDCDHATVLCGRNLLNLQ